MPPADRRLAPRLPLPMPAAIRGRKAACEAGLVDVSRTGVCLRVRAVDLGFSPTLDLQSTAAHVARVLPDRVEVSFRHAPSGTEVTRAALVTRLALPADAPDRVELGCLYDEPLADDVGDALGLPPTPPPVEHEGEIAEDLEATDDRRVLVPRPAGAGAPAGRHVHRAFLTPSGTGGPPPLLCTTEQVSRMAVRVRLPRDADVGTGTAGAAHAFTERYGTRLAMKIVDGPRHLWTGPVRVCGVEMPPERPEWMLVTLAFGRRLRPAEVRRLGLDTAAA